MTLLQLRTDEQKNPENQTPGVRRENSGSIMPAAICPPKEHEYTQISSQICNTSLLMTEKATEKASKEPKFLLSAIKEDKREPGSEDTIKANLR